MSDSPTNITSPPSSRLKLVYDATQSHVAASIPIRWCVDPSLYDDLAERGIARPYLLIEVRPYSMVDDYTYEYDEATGMQIRTLTGKTRDYPMIEYRRYIVSLTQELQYIRFDKPGMNEVFAQIVWIERGSERRAIKMLEATYIRNYRDEPLTTIDDSDGRIVVQVIDNTADTFDVDVPDVMFAREYPPVVADYLRKLFPSKADDECSMRGRLLVGILVATPALIWAYLPRLAILLIATATGFIPGLDLRGFIHPIRYETGDMVENTGRSLWWMNKDKQVHPMWTWSLNPITPVIVWLVFAITTHHVTRHGTVVTEHFSWLYAAKYSVALHIAWAVVFGVIDALIGVMLWIGRNKPVDIPAPDDAAQRAEDLARLKTALDAMTCDRVADGNGMIVKLSALPPEKRTWKLRYQKTKARVCKPFAK